MLCLYLHSRHIGTAKIYLNQNFEIFENVSLCLLEKISCHFGLIVIIANVTIMGSVTYGKCNLCQVLLMANVLWAKCDYGKCNYGKSIMANETEPCCVRRGIYSKRLLMAQQ